MPLPLALGRRRMPMTHLRPASGSRPLDGGIGTALAGVRVRALACSKRRNSLSKQAKLTMRREAQRRFGVFVSRLSTCTAQDPNQRMRSVVWTRCGCSRPSPRSSIGISSTDKRRISVELRGFEPLTPSLRKMWSKSSEQGKRHQFSGLWSGCGASHVRHREAR
jgi:hypothetical protein